MSILKSRRLILAMLGSRLHAAFPRTMSLATMRGRNERWTFRSPLIAKLLPVELLTLRAIGSRNQFQSKNATTRTISTISARKTPAIHLSERGSVMAVWEAMRTIFNYRFPATTTPCASVHTTEDFCHTL